MAKNRTIKVDYLARVEGEGRLYLRIKDGRVAESRFTIFEPPRFFEAFLRGRHFSEAPDITARICGICPVAYQMSAVHAMEDALGIRVPGPLRDLRRLIYCGEWIESHSLHVFLLHAPDFLGYQDGFKMAKDHPDIVKMGLRLKKVGNDLVARLGGREVHPINVRVGGFYRTPAKAELEPLAEELKRARDSALEAVRWTARLPFPDFERDYEFVSVSHPEEYPMNEGHLRSNQGLDIAAADYEEHFLEEQAPHSHALHSRLKERGPYFVGPLARYNLNFERLTPLAQDAAREAGMAPPCLNPFKSIVVRCVEILYAVEEALSLIENYERPEEPYVAAEPRDGAGCGATEAPRGTLYHRYSVNSRGLIEAAKIVPPTSQNQKSIEADLVHYASHNMDLPNDRLTWQCEQLIRNYDPCISCATHCLRLEIER
jgi:coenzyme F420-reducing hydrogenase alpha subunit